MMLNMYVLTIGQRGSQKGLDLVPKLMADLADIPTVLAFERTVADRAAGNEVQGILDSPAAVVEVAMRVLRHGQWTIGIGIGAVKLPPAASPREGNGSAFVQARHAMNRAKKKGERVPLSVQGVKESTGAHETAEPHQADATAAADAKAEAKSVAAAEAVLVLIGDLVRKRSQAEWRVLDMLETNRNLRQLDVSRALDISPQAVSKAIQRSGWQEERAGREAAVLLLALACQGNGSVPEAL